MDGPLVISAVLVSERAVHVRDISPVGAQLETPVYLPIGTVGTIEVDFDGAQRLEWFRVCRIHTTHGCSGAHMAAAEFLPIDVADRRSLRSAVRRVLARDAHLLIP
jgi:hypothetical protein